MSAKHTPGPWSVPHFARPDINCECKYVLCDSAMGAVCAVYASGDGEDWEKHGDNPKFEEAVANAHLIAAAPDLLEALIELAKEHDSTLRSLGITRGSIPLRNAVAAISRATGEAQ